VRSLANDQVELFGFQGGGERARFNPAKLLDVTAGQFWAPSIPPWLNVDNPVSADDSVPVVGMVDTGVALAHPMIRATLALAEDFTDEGLDDHEGHGTAVALVLLSSSPTPVRLISAKSVGRWRRGEQELAAGISWLANQDVRSINLSVGKYNRSCDGRTCSLCRETTRAAEAGVLILVAGGNTAGQLPCPAKARAYSDSIIVFLPSDSTTNQCYPSSRIGGSIASLSSDSATYQGPSFTIGESITPWKTPHEYTFRLHTPPDSAFTAALKAHREGRTTEAISGYRELTKADGQTGDHAAYNLALLLPPGSDEAGVLYARAARSTKPQLAAEGWNGVGGWRGLRGDWPGAIAASRTAFELARDEGLTNQGSMALYNVAVAYYRNGELHSAYDAVKECHEFFPGTEWWDQAFVLLGMILEDVGDWDHALSAYSEAAALSSEKARREGARNLELLRQRLGRQTS
jgi:Subtilase family